MDLVSSDNLKSIPKTDIPTKRTGPTTAGLTTRVVKGSMWTLAGQALPLGVSLVATPFVIRLLGAEGYGVLILVGLIPTYLGFADFGMGLASTKFGSEAYAAGDPAREARTVRTAAVITLCAALPVAIAIFILSAWLITLFNVPEHLAAEASMALKVASVTFVVNFLNAIFNTPQLARLRMDLNTFVTSGFRILGIIATPIVLYLGGGIIGAAVVLLAAALLTLAGHVCVSGRLLPLLFDFTIDRTIIHPLLKFGVSLVGASIAALSLANLEKLILPSFTTVETLAHYTVAFTLASMLTMFSNSMIQSLIPAFAQLQASERREQLQDLYSRGIRLNLIFLVPALVALAIIAKPFFTIWAGEDFGRESILPFYILLVGLIINIPAYLPYASIMAAGRTDVFAKLYFAELIPYVVLVSFLTWRFGILGAAAAWSLRIGIDGFLLFFLNRKIVGPDFPTERIGIFFFAALIMAIPFAANLYLQELNLAIIVVFCACAIIYGLVVWRNLLVKQEIDWITNRLKRVF